MIHIHCFESLEAVAHLRGAINSLNRSAPRPDPFSTFEFYENYLAHDENYPAGSGSRIWFLAAFSSEQLVGYLPLRMTTRRLLGKRHATLEFLVKRDTDRPHLVALEGRGPQIGAAMFAYLRKRSRDWSFLELQQQDETSELLAPAMSLDSTGYLVSGWPSLEHCSIPVRWESLHDYVGAMSRKFRANLGRQMRHLLAAGSVQMLGSSDPAVTPLLLSLYLGIETRSWKVRATAGIGRHPSRVEYFRGLLDPAQPMKIGIKVLLIEGIPVAAILCGTFQRRMYALQMVYDERYGRLAPGSALLLMTMREAIDGRYACLNLLSGFGYYKSRWLAQCTPTRIMQIYRSGSLLYWKRVLGDMARRVRSGDAQPKPELFNPSRRDVTDGPATPPEGDALCPEASQEEQERYAPVIAQICRGQVELLATSELAAAMPFNCPAGTGSRNSDSSTMPARLISSPTSIPASAPMSPKVCIPQ